MRLVHKDEILVLEVGHVLQAMVFLDGSVLVSLRILLQLHRLAVLYVLVAHHGLVHDLRALAEGLAAFGVLHIEVFEVKRNKAGERTNQSV